MPEPLFFMSAPGSHCSTIKSLKEMLSPVSDNLKMYVYWQPAFHCMYCAGTVADTVFPPMLMVMVYAPYS